MSFLILQKVRLNGRPCRTINRSCSPATQRNEIMLAVMKRSESDLRQAIALSPHEIHGRDSGGWTALHLSVNWPTGMLILIEAGADIDCVGTVVGRSLLDIAIGIDSVELLRILGEADCSFAKGSDSCQWYYLRTLELYDPRIIAREEYGHGPISHHGRSSLYSKLSTASTTMAQLLVIFIANRRERLCDLAFEKVPSSVLAGLFPRKTDEPYIIDEKASRLAQELTSRGIAVPPALNPGKKGETGYHAISGRPELAEILWNAGFRDVNGRHSCNMTPLMCCPIETLLRFIDWCLGKGFALNLDIEQDRAWYSGNADELDGLRPGQPLETESVYCKIYALGSLEKYHRSAQKPFVDMLVSCETDRPIAQKIFMASPTDSCKCACSISGCTTRTVLFKGLNDLRGRPYSGYLTTRDMIKFYCDFEDICHDLDARSICA